MASYHSISLLSRSFDDEGHYSLMSELLLLLPLRSSIVCHRGSIGIFSLFFVRRRNESYRMQK